VIKPYKKAVSYSYKAGFKFYRSRPKGSLDNFRTKLIIIYDIKKAY